MNKFKMPHISLGKRSILYISIGLIVAPILIITALNFFGADDSSPKEIYDLSPYPVEVQAVRVSSIVNRASAVGTLIADQSVTIRPEVSGKIKSVLFEGGTYVKAGDPLVEIEDELYKAQLKEAEGGLAFAKVQYERASRLVAGKAGSIREKDRAYSELLQAEARYETAKIKLDNTVVRAPFDGVVGLKEYSVGAFIEERTELVSFVDVDPIKVDFRLPGIYLKSISKGQKIKVKVDGFPNKKFEAEIEAIDAKVDPHAHSIAVRAAIPNESGLLKPGLFARLKIVIGQKENVLVVPESAVTVSGEISYLFKVVEGKYKGKKISIAAKTAVVAGLSEGGNVEIIRGVHEGDQIITVGVTKIRDSFPVRIIQPEEESSDSSDEE